MRIAVFDVESSGVDVENDRIVTAYLGVMEDGQMVSENEWLINPGIEIPQGAIDVHGITNERVQADGIEPEGGLSDIIHWLESYAEEDLPVAGFNLAYDVSMLTHEAKRYSLRFDATKIQWVDPHILDKAVDKYRKGKRTLGVTAEHYGVTDSGGLHDAGTDARLAGRLAEILVPKTKLTVTALQSRQKKWYYEQKDSFEKYLRRTDPTVTLQKLWPVNEPKKEN